MDLISLKQLQELCWNELHERGFSDDEKRKTLSEISTKDLIDRYVNPKQGIYGTGPQYSYDKGQPFTEAQKDYIRTSRSNWGISTKSDSELDLFEKLTAPELHNSDYEFDHIVPKSLNGTNALSNCQVVSKFYNRVYKKDCIEGQIKQPFHDLCRKVFK